MTANEATNGNTTSLMEIDEDLHSRQLAVYGRESMRRMAAASVLIVGLKGLGAEVGKLLTLFQAFYGLSQLTSNSATSSAGSWR